MNHYSSETPNATPVLSKMSNQSYSHILFLRIKANVKHPKVLLALYLKAPVLLKVTGSLISL